MLEGMVMHLPKGFSYEHGAAVPETWITAFLELILLGQLGKGQTILIHAGKLASMVIIAAVAQGNQPARDLLHPQTVWPVACNSHIATRVCPRPGVALWVLRSSCLRSQCSLCCAGASGVGAAAIQIARAVGAKTIFVTASSQEKLDFCKVSHTRE